MQINCDLLEKYISRPRLIALPLLFKHETGLGTDKIPIYYLISCSLPRTRSASEVK